jgi:hypothetical protein
MLNNIEITSGDILLSGGAAGADTAFGKAAHKAGHQVVHWSFNGHKVKLKNNVYALTDEQLKEADPFLIRANKSIVRTFPASSEHTNNLLRRNYFQVKWSQSVYAVSSFTDDSSMMKVFGGTAWAIQLYADRFLYDREPFDNCHLYLFDQKSDQWFQWNRSWTKIQTPPCPQGVYAGIGSRELTDAGLAAINSLYVMDAEASLPQDSA